MIATDASRTNTRPGECTDCGGEVAPGAGSLWWQPGPDDGGDVVGRTPAGWRVTHLDESICRATKAAERAREEQELRDRLAGAEAAREAEKAAIAEQERFVAELLAAVPDCVCAGYDWSRTVLDRGVEAKEVSCLALRRDANPALSGLSLGHSDWSAVQAVTGERCYIHKFGNAAVLHGPRAVVEAAWRALATPEGWAGYSKESAASLAASFAPDKCEAWLAEYGPGPDSAKVRRARERGETSPWSLGPCAGWEARAFLAGRSDLLNEVTS